MKKKEYIQPIVKVEHMLICNILAGSNEMIDVSTDDDEEEEGVDAKMFGRFSAFEDY